MKPHIKSLKRLGACKEAVTWAAQSASYASYAAAARKDMRKRCADIVRQHHPIAPTL